MNTTSDILSTTTSPFHSIPSIPFHSFLPFPSFHSIPFHSIPFHFHSIPFILHSIPAVVIFALGNSGKRRFAWLCGSLCKARSVVYAGTFSRRCLQTLNHPTLRTAGMPHREVMNIGGQMLSALLNNRIPSW